MIEPMFVFKWFRLPGINSNPRRVSFKLINIIPQSSTHICRLVINYFHRYSSQNECWGRLFLYSITNGWKTILALLKLVQFGTEERLSMKIKSENFIQFTIWPTIDNSVFADEQRCYFSVKQLVCKRFLCLYFPIHYMTRIPMTQST